MDGGQLVKCSKCGGGADLRFYDTHDLIVTVVASVECFVCDNESHCFSLPEDAASNAKMGELIEKLAIEHWNMINTVRNTKKET